MGIVNRTPDSFYDGGRYLAEDSGERAVVRLVEEGADIVDLGAESTRPGSPPVSAAEQLDRLGGLVAFAAQRAPMVSVDTTLPEVAEQALRQGADMINSVSLAPAAELGALCAAHQARLVLTHCRGSMADMSGFSVYADEGYVDVVGEVKREWSEAAQAAVDAGLPAESIVFDPGLGFTKNAVQSLELCARLAEFRALGHDILVGTSRKSYIARVVAKELGSPEPAPAERLGGSIAAAVACAAAGADILRVHDVAATRQALAYRAALAAAAPFPTGDEATAHGGSPGGGEGA
ncbi:MAG: dihydropteroate synthase [Deltaproteobacteria bacterium]|jgi:dihydropteroate synthase|nr:dihydropteroate synthase [Deltaproteobacteria bacterium]MBW2537840.1 dihydropteroate synthase [Deltaproteobacteria bacterium]